MGLNIIDDSELITPDKMESDGTFRNAFGGTELMNAGLMSRIDPDLAEQFNIIKSRVRTLHPTKQNILWLHDTWDDPESQHLRSDASRARFSKLVFVSDYQMATYNMGLGVPYGESIVMKNAIEPIPYLQKDMEGPVRLIYHTTPHRGLNILVPVVEKLSEEFGDQLHLDVFSSFEAYGWPERDAPYKDLFETIKAHPNMTYHGFKPNGVVREYLRNAHIFAYPSIWPETSCIAAIEAMSAGCEIVCPNLAALPETTGNFATMYQWHEDLHVHANMFANVLYHSIKRIHDEQHQRKLMFQKNWTDNFYGWNLRAAQWDGLLRSLVK